MEDFKDDINKIINKIYQFFMDTLQHQVKKFDISSISNELQKQYQMKEENKQIKSVILFSLLSNFECMADIFEILEQVYSPSDKECGSTPIISFEIPYFISGSLKTKIFIFK